MDYNNQLCSPKAMGRTRKILRKSADINPLNYVLLDCDLHFKLEGVTIENPIKPP